MDVSMHANKDELPMVAANELALARQVAWGGMVVARESFAAGLDPAPLYRGLPDDRCQCPHWGYVVRGRVRVRYPDREEILRAGDVYYLEPGHLNVFEEDTEIIEFSPVAPHGQTMAAIARNLQALETAPEGSK